MITLKDFQKNVVDKLLSFTAPEYGVNELVIKAPTGSGKTICLLSWIDRYISTTHDNVAFVWFTPGAGELEEQSQDKARVFSGIKAQSVNDALLQGFDKGSATFINYESVVGKNKKAMLTDSERDNLEDKIEKAFQQGRHFILVIDEAHRNDTMKARDVISLFRASKTVRVSATIEDPKIPAVTEFYEVTEESVIDSGLIAKSVVVNEDVDIELEVEDEFAILFEAAENKRKEIVKGYSDNGVTGVNPLVIVQLPDKSDSEADLVSRVETYLKETLKKRYEDGTLGIWLADRKRNHLDVTELNNNVEYLIIKQAIATGWDAPRAKILIKLRENMGEAFTIQTIGRIRRMPQPQRGHYDVDVLDNAYLYTFDSDFLTGAFAQGGAVALTPVLRLKDKAKELRLISERIIDVAPVPSEKNVLSNLYEGLKASWNLSDDCTQNRQIVEKQGFPISRTIKTTYKQGRFDTLAHLDRLQDRERYIEVDYRGNRLELLHAFHELDRVIHLPVSKVEAILKRFFLKDARPKKESLLQLDAQEWTAFILNHWKGLREEFRKVDVAQALPLELENIQSNDFSLPLEERFGYNPKLEGELVRSSAYEGYTTASIAVRPSLVERLFERYLEDRNDVAFVYKNGDKGFQYFSLAYKTNAGRSHFYPDFILQMKNGDIYIIETKGGKASTGQDKNIDPYAPAKYEALKDYARRHRVKWAFVRDYDEELWFRNMDEWLDDMTPETWRKIDDLFGRDK
ncbi:DEAD/DEAH box helicase [Streptococcus acidominimus]|uniref:DEAD/DEAH box helicase n=1 Tax=Streptococcus acidominimus TaxID=1326 RepID=A0A4Y9FPQ5_STRAI|nr:DEAD/DEAH box helicase family protein [Streptococcus acidominimus]MBF0819001.1 DEAD/DEAH box helicase family protein [Streptococcus acidominimus]MBF0839283.1 DEAD/DEAH box helicase family protein [Streptococcus acidominimus]MBF0847047.1 DEAD/DEAH box helicase family protein [Streptococcus danieliae]TFU30510.1 DEAD/DEAH box helicase [Streptococcus acidominimus]